MSLSLPSLRGLLCVALLGTLFAVAPTPALAQTLRTELDKVPVEFDTDETDVEAFSMIGLSWTGTAITPPDVDVLIDSVWSALSSADAEPDKGPDLNTAEAATAESTVAAESFTEATWVGEATGYRVRRSPGVTSATVHLIREKRVLVPALSSDAQAAPAAPNGPPVRPRSDWGASAPTGSISTAPTLRMAVVHHTAGSNDYTPEQVPSIIKGIQTYHQRSQGWSDIGYNFLVDRFGVVWEGRAGGIGAPVIGAHAAGFNTGSVGVSIIGDYSSAGASPTVLDAVGQVVGWKLSLHGVNPNGSVSITGDSSNMFPNGQTVTLPTVLGHRDVGQTTCPGRVHAQLGSIRAAAAAYPAAATGSLDSAVQTSATSATVSGWGFDRRTSDPAQVVVLRNGTEVARATTSLQRTDVTNQVPSAPSTPGFSLAVPLSDGANNVCVYIAETSYGANTELGCRSFRTQVDPTGVLDSVTLSPTGVISVSGWAFDPNTSDPIPVHVYVNNKGSALQTGNSRPDVAAAVPGAPGNSGFSTSIPVGPGAPFTVCAYAMNVGPGSSNPLLGCATVGTSPDPTGEFIVAVNHRGQALVGGWALDYDTQAPVNVLFFNNDRLAWLAPAMHHWDGLIGRFPTHGTNRLFFSLMPLNRGNNRICAYALNVGPGNHTLLGCHNVWR